jgi:peptide/nickel transport system permease protein
MFLGFAVGIPLGVLTAAKSGSGVDHVSRLMSITGVALPSFWLAMILQLVFAKILSIFPLSGRLDFMVEIENPVSHITGFFVVDSLVTGNWTALRDALTHIILPGITLAVYPLGLSARLVRTTMLEVLGEDFIRTARASGLGEIKVLTVYALRNALGPIITVAVLTFGYSLVSTFLIESLFAWPGLGRYSAKAIVSVDYPAIMGVTLLIATFYTILNLLADLLQAFMDPRIRLS